MKIVLDTNVLVSGIFWGGTPLKVLELSRHGKIQLLASEVILTEYMNTISRIAKKTGRPDLYRTWELILPSRLTLVAVKKSFQLCRDPHDNGFIDCAVAGKAKYIITGDDDLLVLKQVMGVHILKPRQFLLQF